MADGTEGHGARRKAGRPPLPDEDRRTEKVDVRATGAEVRTMMGRARAAGLSLRDYVRRAALGAAIVAPVDPVTLSHAARLVEVGRLLARVERLAVAGRIVGLPPADIAELRRLAEAAAVAVLGVADEEGDPVPCSP